MGEHLGAHGVLPWGVWVHVGSLSWDLRLPWPKQPAQGARQLTRRGNPGPHHPAPGRLPTSPQSLIVGVVRISHCASPAQGCLPHTPGPPLPTHTQTGMLNWSSSHLPELPLARWQGLQALTWRGANNRPGKGLHFLPNGTLQAASAEQGEEAGDLPQCPALRDGTSRTFS